MNKVTSLLSITIIMTLLGCKTSPDSDKKNNDDGSKVSELTKLYNHLHELGDDQSCIYTLQNILFIDSTKTEYYDSLVFHYAKAGNFMATEKMIAKSLIYGKNIKVMEYAALIEGQKGNIKGAITKLNELFTLTTDYKYKISIFNMNLEMGEVKGAEDVLKELEGLENLNSIKIEQLVSETETQEVPLKAAIILGRAQIEAYAKNNFPGAQKYIKEALEIKPDFQNALGLREKIIQATQQRR